MHAPPTRRSGWVLEVCSMPYDDAKHHAALMDDVTAFRHYIAGERGMAATTVLAYGRDLDRFAAWVTTGGLADYLHPTVRELSRYIEFLREEGLAPSSQARHLVALKVFFRFLRLEERTSESTVDLLASPALWQRIPHVLSPESVEKLLASPLPIDRYYLRAKALLATLYATGGPASAALALKLADVNLDPSFRQCMG